MGEMAGEIARRMAEDGVDTRERFQPGATDGPVPNAEVPPTESPGSAGRAAAPGNVGDVPPAQSIPPAGAPNTDTSTGDGDPGPIPYARFKEVNDRLSQLKGYEELSEFGYDPDSLGRLAAFEARYIQNPPEAIMALVEQLDLPSEASEAIKTQLESASSSEASGDGEAPQNEDTGTVGLSKEDRELLDWARTEREARVEATRQAQLDSVVNSWTDLDKKDEVKVTVPERQKLMYISAVASSGRFASAEDLAKAARTLYWDDQDSILGTTVQPSRRGGSPPPALPGGAAPTPPIVPRTFAEANKLAEAALKAGNLPPLETR